MYADCALGGSSIMKEVARGRTLCTCPTTISLTSRLARGSPDSRASVILSSTPLLDPLSFFFFSTWQIIILRPIPLRSFSTFFSPSTSSLDFSRRNDQTAGSVRSFLQKGATRRRIFVFFTTKRTTASRMSIIFLARLALQLLGAKWRRSKGGITFRKCRYQRGFYWIPSTLLRSRFVSLSARGPIGGPSCALVRLIVHRSRSRQAAAC